MSTTMRRRGVIGVAALVSVAFFGAQRNLPQTVEDFQKWIQARPAAMKQAGDTIQKQKIEAMKNGEYACCLKHPCDFCALQFGKCPCGRNAADKKPVCNECKGAWYASDGAIPGLNPNDIKTMPRPIGGE